LDKYYAFDATLRDAIRKRLLDLLYRYRHKKIMVISHSMGSIIAFDVLSQLPPDISVDTFITIGSPLGIPIIKGKIMQEKREHQPEIKQLITPGAIKSQWINHADIEDKIALDSDLADDFLPNIIGVFPQNEIVQNDYYKNGKRNPHKAYGYLRTPQMAKLLREFITEGRTKLGIWWLKTWGGFANRKYL